MSNHSYHKRENYSDGDTAIYLSPSRQVSFAGPEAVLVVGEEGAALLEGAVYAEILRLLPSIARLHALRSALGRQFDAAAIDTALNQLEALRVLTSQPPSSVAPVDAFWDSAGLPPPQDCLSVVSLAEGADAGVRQALEANGIVIAEGADRALIITDDYLHPEIGKIVQRYRACLVSRPVGHTVCIGPLLGTAESVCCDCFQYWIRAHRWAQQVAGHTQGAYPRQPALCALPSTCALGSSLAATAATTWVASNPSPELMNRIVSLDTRDMHFAEHLFGPSPSCDCCQTRHMVRRPLKTFISSLCGIMPRLNVSSTSFMGFCSAWGQAIAPLPVANARPLLRPIPVSGKGIDAEHAERSCLGEAIERYSAIYQGSERRERASIDELGDACISPDQVFLFSERQYAQREQWNQIADEIGVTPVPLNSSATISWTAVQSLLGREKKFVPTAYCFLWYSDQAEPEIYQADSSGCAAGPDVAFAISSALLELIERDAVTIWWDNQIVRASWPIEQLDRKELITCRDSLAKSGRDFWLLDVTTDISVPACVAVSARTDGTEPYFAAAADLDASTAASRATAELVHLLASGDNLDANYLRWVRSARLGEHPYLRPHGSVIPPIGSRQMSSDRRVETCVRHLQQAGLSPYYLDLTRRETGIPAVRAIVPGLRHPWRRRARGRLYETPVQLGWLTEPRPEAELNPLTCVI